MLSSLIPKAFIALIITKIINKILFLLGLIIVSPLLTIKYIFSIFIVNIVFIYKIPNLSKSIYNGLPLLI